MKQFVAESFKSGSVLSTIILNSCFAFRAWSLHVFICIIKLVQFFSIQ